MPNLYGFVVWVLGFIGLVLVVWSWRKMKKAQTINDWPIAEGVIEISTPASDENNFTPYVEYKYKVDNNDHTGSLKIESDGTSMPSESHNITNKYPLNSKVNVYYDPSNPQTSTLEPNAGKDVQLIFWLSAGSLVLGLIFVLFKL